MATKANFKKVKGEWGRKSRKYADQLNKGKAKEHTELVVQEEWYYDTLEMKEPTGWFATFDKTPTTHKPMLNAKQRRQVKRKCK